MLAVERQWQSVGAVGRAHRVQDGMVSWPGRAELQLRQQGGSHGSQIVSLVPARARGDSTRLDSTINIICPALEWFLPRRHHSCCCRCFCCWAQPLGMLVRVPAHHTLISRRLTDCTDLAAGGPTALVLATLPT